MDIFEEELEQAKKKRMKTMKTAIIVSIVILIILAGIIMMMAMKIQAQKLTVIKDQVVVNANPNIFEIKENGKVYVDIQAFAKLVGDNYQVGDEKDQDPNKGCILKSEEDTFFQANSKKVIKKVKENKKEEEYYYIDEPIKYNNGKLYTTIEGVNLIFNVNMGYDKANNRIIINTLKYMETYFTGKLAEWGYKSLASSFTNKRALVDGYIIAVTEDKKVGIRTTDNKELVGPKYKDIEYVRGSEEFFMTNEAGQKGLITKLGQTKIRCEYSDIDVLDSDMELYLVTKDNKKGVINKDNKKIIYIEYDEIGIEKNKYSGSDLQNPYLIYNNCIPAKKDDKWGLLDKEGNEILGFEYDNIGCINSTSSVDMNVIVIPEYEAIVMKKDKYYGIYNSLGKELVPCALKDVTQTVEKGKVVYEMTYKENKLNVEAYFESHGISKVSTSSTETTDEAGKDIEIKNPDEEQNNNSNEDNQNQDDSNSDEEQNNEDNEE